MSEPIDDAVVSEPVDAIVIAPVAHAVSIAPTSPAPVVEELTVVDPVPVDAVPMSDALADAVMSQLASQMPDLTAEQIKSVVAAVNTVQSGDEVGCVRKSADGVIAVRISLDGVHKWHLVNPVDGSRWDDNENAHIMKWPSMLS